MTNSLSRREFLVGTAVLTGSTLAIGGVQDLIEQLSTAAPNADLELITGLEENFVSTVCLMCPSGCGMIGRVVDGNLVKVEGNPMHPINTGALCPKGQAVPELLYNPDRLAQPLRRVGERGAGEWEPISWEEATRLVAEKLQEVRDSGHPERFTLMYGETRGQMREFLERFTTAIGSPNAISHDSLNIEASKLAMYLTQGIYDLPAYDIENTNYILSFGANLLEAGRVPQRTAAGYAFMRRGRARRGKIVMIDPRQGITGAKSDEWIPIRPGTDAALALGLANVLISTGKYDSDFAINYGFGFEDFHDENRNFFQGFKTFVMENYPPSEVERITGVPANTIVRIAGEFAENAPSIAIMPSKGGLLNGSVNGLYTAMAVHILNALVGSIEKPGGVMVQRYMPQPEWPPLPEDPVAKAGLGQERADGAGTAFPIARHAYQAVADRVLDGYGVDVLMLYDANPVYETPIGSRFVEAFQEIPFIVSFNQFLDDTAQYADLVLPEPTFLERFQDDHIEGLGYPGIGLRQPVVEPRLDTMPVGDFLLKVAASMDEPVASSFPWSSYEELLQERLSLIGITWDQLRDFGVWLTPIYRFSRRGSPIWLGEVIGADRKHAPRDGRFDFFSRELWTLLRDKDKEERAAMGFGATGNSVFLPHYEPVEMIGSEEEYPFMLNVITLMSLGSYSMNANLPTLQEITGMTVGTTWDSWVEMNPEVAEHHHLESGEEVWVESEFGRLKTKVRFVPGLRPDVVNVPYNQGHNFGRWAKQRGVNGLEIINPATEPVTGLASLTNTRVRITKIDEDANGHD